MPNPNREITQSSTVFERPATDYEGPITCERQCQRCGKMQDVIFTKDCYAFVDNFIFKLSETKENLEVKAAWRYIQTQYEYSADGSYWAEECECEEGLYD